jgi:hypothetical protein
VIGQALLGFRACTAALLLVAGAVGAHGAAFAAEQMAPLAARIIAAEGGPGDNPLSSASGYGQFLRDTWLDIFRRVYPRLALILTGEQILALREVKPLAEQLTDRFAQENAVALGQLGLPASDATLSLAHAVGAGGAINVLTSAPGRPLRELLSPQAIAANPAFGGMTAEQLRHWATTRVAAPAATPATESPTASREEGAAAPRRALPEVIAPAQDFRVDGREKASQILTENRATVERLQSFVEAASAGAISATPLPAAAAAWLTSVGIDAATLQRGEPASLRSLQQAAKALVFAAIREVAVRPAYREFMAIARADRPGEPKLTVLRDVATALADTMRREDALLLSIAAHRRGAGAGRLVADGYTGGRGRSDRATRLTLIGPLEDRR